MICSLLERTCSFKDVVTLGSQQLPGECRRFCIGPAATITECFGRSPSS